MDWTNFLFCFLDNKKFSWIRRNFSGQEGILLDKKCFIYGTGGVYGMKRIHY